MTTETPKPGNDTGLPDETVAKARAMAEAGHSQAEIMSELQLGIEGYHALVAAGILPGITITRRGGVNYVGFADGPPPGAPEPTGPDALPMAGDTGENNPTPGDFGGIFQINREAILNDDLGALENVARLMAESAQLSDEAMQAVRAAGEEPFDAGEALRTAHSSSDFPLILENAMGKTVARRFQLRQPDILRAARRANPETEGEAE